MQSTPIVSPVQPAGKLLQIGIWTAQVLIFASFTLFGCMKLAMPVDQLAAMWVWPGEVPTWILRLLGVIDIAGGLGVLLPALTRIQPHLTVVAGFGCVILQISAIIFHLSRGEAPAVPLNFILLALAAIILWGRYKIAPIAPRG